MSLEQLEPIVIIGKSDSPESEPIPVRTTSEKQIEANRRNAQKSTGPRTEAGKSRSALNALRHGLTGHVTVMTPAQREAHDLFLSSYMTTLNPGNPVEFDLAEAAAEDAWRLKRARALEENIYALGHPELTAFAELSVDIPGEGDPELAVALAHARTFMANPKNLQLLTLYEQRLHRSHQKSLSLLREMQGERKAAYDKAFDEAQLLAQLNYHQGLPYDPAEDFPIENGFVFSTAQINAAIDRNRRLKQAREQVKSGSSPRLIHHLPNAA